MKEARVAFSGGRSGRGRFIALALSGSLAACGGGSSDGAPAAGGQSGSSNTGGARAGGSGGGSTSTGGRGGSDGTGGAPSGAGGSTGAGGGAAASGGAPGGSADAGTGAGGASGGTSGGSGGNPGMSGSDAGASGSGGAGGSPSTGNPMLDKFSFFVVSLKALQTLSGKTEGFGGDLRFGKADGLAGADEICRQAAEMGMPGAGKKTWRALLSASKGGENGGPVHARDRIGKGPWYGAKGQLLAKDLNDLFAGERPVGDQQLVNDMTNERGEPNHYVGTNGFQAGVAVDNHDTLTGSDAMGRFSGGARTCNDWTSTTGAGPMIGHSWPRSPRSGRSWISDHSVPNCTPGLDRTLGGTGTTIGSSGGYGGFFCFAVQ